MVKLHARGAQWPPSERPAAERLRAALHAAAALERQVDAALSDIHSITDENWLHIMELRRTLHDVRRRIVDAADELSVEVKPLPLTPRRE